MQDQIVARSKAKRLSYLATLFVLLGVLFLVRLFERQILQRDEYNALAEKQYYTKIDQPAKRGDVYIKDKDSQNLIDETRSGLFPVATDLELFNVTAVPRHITDKKAAAEKLAKVLGEDEKKIFDEINVDKWYIAPLKKRISKEQADRVASQDIKGIYLEGQYGRYYPEKEFMAHILGFVDYDGKGNYGIEEFYDGVLRGEGGTLTGLKDNMGKIIKIEQSAPGKDGTSIVLTIDRSIQYMAEKKLKEGIEKYGAEGGSIVILDPKTGAIMAMASSPSYDPNKYNEVKTDQQSIFLNPAVCLNWEPGSIFKPIVVSAGVDQKIIEPDSKPDNPFSNFVTVDGYDIHNSQDKPFGFESVTQILENSDNVGMVWVADKIGNDLLGEYLRKYGFGAKTGVDLSGEAQGQLAAFKKWKDVNRATISFGQGISTTPLQIAASYAAIANKGKLVKPHIVDGVLDESGVEKQAEPVEPIDVVSEETANKVSQMLISVVENGHGKKAQVEGFKVAGKTGTAQIPKSDGGYEENTHIGSFAGFAPVDDPKFVMLVKFDKPKNVEWAESSAAPIFGDIASWLLNSYFKVPKST